MGSEMCIRDSKSTVVERTVDSDLDNTRNILSTWITGDNVENNTVESLPNHSVLTPSDHYTTNDRTTDSRFIPILSNGNSDWLIPSTTCDDLILL